MDQITRSYKVKFRLCIGDTTSQRPPNFLRYYRPKWSVLMREIMSIRLPALPSTQEGPASVRELPALRKVVPLGLKTETIIQLVTQCNSRISRLLLDAYPFFDAAPQDLKVHILAAIGITAEMLEDYLNTL